LPTLGGAALADENKDYLLVVEVKSTTVCRERIDEILDGRITDKEGRSAQQQLIDAAKKWNHSARREKFGRLNPYLLNLSTYDERGKPRQQRKQER